MEKIVVCNVENLFSECVGHEIGIYGAKTVAMRACHFLEGKGLKVNSFVVSNRYNNPEILMNKPVIRIEDANRIYDCMIVAVSGKFVRDVEKELESYDISKLVIINPLMDDDFPTCCLISGSSKISEKAFLSTKVQLISDESSCIIVDDNAVVKDGTIIIASANSRIHIGHGTYIGEKSYIVADDHSEIEVCNDSELEEKSRLYSVEDSHIYLGKHVRIRYMGSIAAAKKSFTRIGDLVTIDVFAHVWSFWANITIGKESTFGTNLLIGAERSDIEIGDDNMFSHYVKMNTGSHKIIDRKIGKDITNRKKIRTGNHVWVGMGATLLPGCNVGNHSIVGASAVVTKEIENYAACAGNPAVVIKQGIDWDRDNSPEEE